MTTDKVIMDRGARDRDGYETEEQP